jgi:hypothetical protein
MLSRAACRQEMDELSLGTRRYPRPPALRRHDATTTYDEWTDERTYRLDVRRAVPDGTGRRTWYLTVQVETAVADAATLSRSCPAESIRAGPGLSLGVDQGP